MGSAAQAALLRTLGIQYDPGAGTQTSQGSTGLAALTAPGFLDGIARQDYQPPQPVQQDASTGASMLGGGVAAQGGLSPAEAWIIQHESGGNVNARNKSSGAFGLGQLNPSSGTLQGIARELGVDPYSTDYNTQLAEMRRYIADRYGTAENAQRFWMANHWY